MSSPTLPLPDIPLPDTPPLQPSPLTWDDVSAALEISTFGTLSHPDNTIQDARIADRLPPPETCHYPISSPRNKISGPSNNDLPAPPRKPTKTPSRKPALGPSRRPISGTPKLTPRPAASPDSSNITLKPYPPSSQWPAPTPFHPVYVPPYPTSLPSVPSAPPGASPFATQPFPPMSWLSMYGLLPAITAMGHNPMAMTIPPPPMIMGPMGPVRPLPAASLPTQSTSLAPPVSIPIPQFPAAPTSTPAPQVPPLDALKKTLQSIRTRTENPTLSHPNRTIPQSRPCGRVRSAKKSVPSTYEKAARRISKTRLPTETRQTSQFPKQVHSNIVPHSGPCENVLPKSSTRAVNSKRSIVPVEQPHKTLQREDDVNMFAGPQVPDEQAVDEELYINTEQQKRTGKISTAWKPTRNLGKNLRRRGRGGHVRSSERGRVEIKSSSNPSQEVSSWTYVDGSQGKEPSFERPSLPFAAPVNEMLNGQRSVSRKRAVQTPNKVWRKAKQPRNNQITQLNVHRNWRGGRGGHQSFRRGKGARGGRWNGVEEDKRGNFEMKQEVHVIDDSQTDFEADDHTSMAASHIHPSQTWVGAQQPTHC